MHVDPRITSDKWPVWPDPTLLGHADIIPVASVTAGSLGTWTIRYRVGPAGIDDGGRLKLCFRINSDWGVPQFTDPTAANFVTLSTTANARLTPSYDPRGHIRPWSKAVTVLVDDGYLAEGELVHIVLGDTTAGGPGFETRSPILRNARVLPSSSIPAERAHTYPCASKAAST